MANHGPVGLLMERPTIGQPCRVHYNLHTHLWSVSVKTAKGWRVRGNVASVTIRNAVAKVSLSGVARIRAKQCRAVVARVEGTLVSLDGAPLATRVHYNPYRCEHFHTDPSNPVPWQGASLATFTSDGAMWSA